jgi:hypothetical protein
VKARIAVLLHRRQRKADLRHYLISYLADIWLAEGLEVIYLFGVDRCVPADLLIVHVDLSVVPDAYLDFACRYPRVLNGELRDIRKAKFTTHRVTSGGDYSGRVIMKSNLNHAGLPDERLARMTSVARLAYLAGRVVAPSRHRKLLAYKIYQRVQDLPAGVFESDHFVVEEFVPELENGLYHVRRFDVLGDRFTCLRMASKQPVVRGRWAVSSEAVEPHPQMFQLRRKLNLDYGNLEYVLHDGVVHLIDINKTLNAGAVPGSLDAYAQPRQHLAEGIYAYLG